MPKERTLQLTIQRDLSVPDWNEKTGDVIHETVPAGTIITIPLLDGEIDPDHWTDLGEPEYVLRATAIVPCEDFYSDSADFEMQFNQKYFGCLRFEDFMYDQKHFTRCKGDKTQCPSRTVRQEAHTDLTNREVIS